MFYEHNEWILFAARMALLSVTLLCFALAFGSWRRTGRRDMQSVIAETHELAGLLHRLSDQVAQMNARIEDRRELVAASAGAAFRGYDLALQLARNGAAPQEIAGASGVALNEAELLARVHGPERTPVAQH